MHSVKVNYQRMNSEYGFLLNKMRLNLDWSELYLINYLQETSTDPSLMFQSLNLIYTIFYTFKLISIATVGLCRFCTEEENIKEINISVLMNYCKF